METLGFGPSSAKICILCGEKPSVSALAEKVPFHGWDFEVIKKCLLTAGLHPDDIRFELVICPSSRTEVDEIRGWLFPYLNGMSQLEVIVPLGDNALYWVSGLKSIDKWHLSPVDTVGGLNCKKAVPTYTPLRIRQDHRLNLYMTKAFQRVAEGLKYSGPWKRKPKFFQLNPNYEETIATLERIKSQPVLAVDIETGGGVINTVGFAWSASEAIAIQTLPERLSAEKFHHLWKLIADILENKSIKKVYQNLIYETLYFSRYGIKCENFYHDTMWAQRLLWPEFEVGLDNVGRMYTNEPYWKDTGKDYKGEGTKRDWSNIKDWSAHFLYNCLDTSGTFEAFNSQRCDLLSRGLEGFFDNYLMRLADPIAEMCCRGLPVNESTRRALEIELEAKTKDLAGQLSTPINPKSWKQKQTLLKKKGYSLPSRRDKETGERVESTNELALKKLRIKHPEDEDLRILLELTHMNKALGSYVGFTYDKDGRLRFMMNGAGTETLRFSSSKDPWDRGLNAQTLPKKYKTIFDSPPGKTWLQVDLKQAESRFVAYDCADAELIKALEDSSRDVHSEVAEEIVRTLGLDPAVERSNKDKWKERWRQLGKKSGHGANYDMGASTFMESCLKEMDVVLSKTECEKILGTYHRLFPGIRRGHAKVRNELFQTRKLSNPFGYTRYFYGRMDDNTFREAYAFKPQSTIPMIMNHLMLHLLRQRDEGKLHFDLHLQCHDSLLMLVNNEAAAFDPIANECLRTEGWHPEIRLAAGTLIIPTEIELGTNLGKLKVYHPGEDTHGRQ